MLYINNEYCTSLKQLKDYFYKLEYTNTNTFVDLLDRGRDGEIAQWLRDIGEETVAEQVDAIDVNLSDSDYVNRLNLAITGQSSSICTRPDFYKCFKIEDVKTEQEGAKIVVNVILKVLMSVNEEYAIILHGGKKPQTKFVTPYDYVEGENCSIFFTAVDQSELNMLELCFDGKSIKISELSNNNSLFPITSYNYILGVTSLFDDIDNQTSINSIKQGLKSGAIYSSKINGIEFVFDKKGILANCKIENGTQMPYKWSECFSWHWSRDFDRWVDVLHRKDFIIYETIKPYKTSNNTWYGKILAQSSDYKYRICIVFDDSFNIYGPDSDGYKLRAKYISIDLMPEASPRKDISNFQL